MPSDGSKGPDAWFSATLFFVLHRPLFSIVLASIAAACGGSELTKANPPTDAGGAVDSSTTDSGATASGLAGFAFIVNDVVQQPMACVGEDWEFPPFPVGTSCNPDPEGPPQCSGVSSVSLVNTGQTSLAYYATNLWSGGYVPGAPAGAKYELAGVLSPGARVDITSVFDGGMTALLGSARPFSGPDASHAYDEGSIPWPQGVAGSGGATTMYVMQIDVQPSCLKAAQEW